MNKFGLKSLAVRATLDGRLQWMVDEVLKHMDVSLIYGHRVKEEQNLLYDLGRSQLQWPESKHNVWPSIAVDMQPYPYPTKENDLRAGLGYMAGLCWMLAEQQGFSIRWGGDWNRNGSVADNGFDDLFHVEIY